LFKPEPVRALGRRHKAADGARNGRDHRGQPHN